MSLRMAKVELERWLLKTTLNICYEHGNGYTWGFSGTKNMDPPIEFVEAAFGLRELPEHMGLYVAAAEGQTIDSNDSVFFAPVLYNKESIYAALFEFRGFRFFLALMSDRPPDRAVFLENFPPGWRDSRFLYHLRRINYHLQRISATLGKKHRSQVVEIRW